MTLSNDVLKSATDEISRTCFQDFDSKFHVSSILKFAQSDMDFADQDARLGQETEFLTRYISESFKLYIYIYIYIYSGYRRKGVRARRTS